MSSIWRKSKVQIKSFGRRNAEMANRRIAPQN